MFKTFRLRLLFWFLVFISSSFIVVLLSVTYLKKREEIFIKSEQVEQAYLTLLKSVKYQQDFFSYETKNPDFFLTSKSRILDEYHYWMDSTLFSISGLVFSESEIQTSLLNQQKLIKEIDTTFLQLTQKIIIRGFKDYNLEGKMRNEAHWLEQAPEVSREDVLSLRRHEKDYIIRNEAQYVEKFSKIVNKIASDLQSKASIPKQRQQKLFAHLQDYEAKFLALVQLDEEIGIKDNTGLKRELDIKIKTLEESYGELVSQTRLWSRKQFDLLTLYFAITVVCLVLVSIVISAIMAHKITQPLTKLTKHITRFVESNFTLESDHPVIKSKDEIGSLTQNFSILKNEVISQLKFFKQRVEERTEELSNANKKLVRLSEANRRFVPTEFVNILNKKGIEEVALGDHVECEMTVVFTDIREFTSISESLNPQENFDFLNRYFGGIVPVVKKHGGFIDKFIGDSVMTLFPGKTDDAIRAVMEFSGFVKEFNNWNKENLGMAPIQIGTGIHTGHLILGTIGHDDRLETTVISDAVNTAARVEGLSKHYGVQIVVTEPTLDALETPDAFDIRFLDQVKVKGKSKSLAVYEIMFPHEKIKIGYNEKYHQGIELIKEKKIIETAEIFAQLLTQNPHDKALKRFMAKYENFLNGNANGWEDITKMHTK